MKPYFILGIDPGVSGGLVVIDCYGELKRAVVMPRLAKGIDFTGLVKELVLIHREFLPKIYLEELRPYRMSAYTSFSMGLYYGYLQAALKMNLMSYEFISPSVWCRTMHLGCDKGLKPKAKSVQVLKDKWPKVDLRKNDKCKINHDGLVDAFLIAQYGLLEMNK